MACSDVGRSTRATGSVTCFANEQAEHDLKLRAPAQAGSDGIAGNAKQVATASDPDISGADDQVLSHEDHNAPRDAHGLYAEVADMAESLQQDTVKRKRVVTDSGDGDNVDVVDPNTPMEHQKTRAHGSTQAPHTSLCTNRSVKKSKKNQVPQKQLYGYEPEGTWIPWGKTRMRKQPRIYPVSRNCQKKPQWMADAAESRVARDRQSIEQLEAGKEEIRLKSWQDHLPDWYDAYLSSAGTQKMFVLERTRRFEARCHARYTDCPEEILQVAGSGGNVYTVTISHLPSCTCPVGLFSKTGDERQCKHILYVLHHVLKAPEGLRYQAAFLTCELKEVFANAPFATNIISEEDVHGERKAVEGDCPICFMELEGGEEITWCKAACGNNMHEKCFEQWARSKTTVTCPLCRTNWSAHPVHDPGSAVINRVDLPIDCGTNGYYNVRDQLAYG